jgi:hypothetical protein
VLPERMFGPRDEDADPDVAAQQVEPSKVSLRELAGEQKAPWHFKLLIVLVVAYLVWRIVQMIGWFI